MISLTLSLNRRLKSLAVRLNGGVHPKHLSEDPDQWWYMQFLHEDDRLLDLGCAQGHHTRRAAAVVQSAHGVDYDAEAIRLASIEAAPNTKFGVANLEDIFGDEPYDEGEYDVVLALDILEHLWNRTQFLRSIHRVLKDDGLLLLSVPNGFTWWKSFVAWTGNDPMSDPDHKIEQNFDGWAIDLEEAGFDVIDVLPAVIDMPLVGLIDVFLGWNPFLYRTATRFRRFLGWLFPSQAAGFNIVCSKAEDVRE